MDLVLLTIGFETRAGFGDFKWPLLNKRLLYSLLKWAAIAQSV